MSSREGVYNVLGMRLAGHALELAPDDMQPLFAFASLALAGLLATPLVCAAAVPSLTTLGSDISLLYNNDLDGTPLSRHLT